LVKVEPRAVEVKMADEHLITGRTKHGELMIDQIASMQPGLGRRMPEISERY